jgi:leader peptidase (prepilin peptidase) / N-methyltransferase
MVTLGSTILAALLVVACAADVRSRRLPDIITVPLIAFGLGLQWLAGGLDQFWLGALGAALGFLSFWLIATLYRRARGYDGLGLGDAKLLAAAGAWLGPIYLAPVVFVAAILALATVQILRLRGEAITTQTIVPFGPFLSIAFFGFWCLKLAGWSWL